MRVSLFNIVFPLHWVSHTHTHTHTQEAASSVTTAYTTTTSRRSFHRLALEQARPWGPLPREQSMHIWAAGRGRDATPVYSLAVVLRGRKGRHGRRNQTLLQCEQSCREVVYHSERYCNWLK